MTIKINDPGSPYAQTQNLEPGFNMELELELFNSSTHEYHLDHSKLQGLHLPDQHPIGAILDLGPRLDEQDERTGILEQDTTTLLQRADEAQARLNAVEPKVSTLETTVAEEQEKVEWLQGESSYYYDELLSHNDRLRDLEWNAGLDKPILDGAVADIAAVEDRVAAVEPKVSNLEIQMAAEMPKTAALQYDAQIEKNKVVALQSDVASAKANIAMIQSDNQAEKAKVIALQGDATTEKLKVTNLQAETNSLDYRLDVAEPKITALQTEVGNARVDTKGVTQVDLDARIDADMATKADKLYATNLVTNGDFSNSLTGWATSDASIQKVVNGAFEFTTSAFALLRQTVSLTLGIKYYVALRSKASDTTNYVVLQFRNSANTAVTSLALPNAPTYTYTSSIVTLPENVTSVVFARSNTNTVVANLDNIMLINLTATFGAGNEPTLAEMDLLMGAYPNSWFDGTKEILPLSMVESWVARKADKVYATNIITNHTLNDTSNIIYNVSTGSVSGNELTVTITSLNSSAAATFYTANVNANEKVYVSFEANPFRTHTAAVYYSNAGKYLGLITQGVYTRVSSVLTNTVSTSAMTIYLNGMSLDGMEVGSAFKIRKPLLINLTKVFGAGNEPTAQEMDLLLSAYPNAWFDGTKEILPLRMVESWVARKADKILATNLVTNGDFSNGTTGWVNYYTDMTISSNVMSLTGNGVYLSPMVNQYVLNASNVGDKYYFCVKQRMMGGNVKSMTLEYALYNNVPAQTYSATNVIQNPSYNEWYWNSIITQPLPYDNSRIRLAIRMNVLTPEEAVGAKMDISYVTGINLTQTFGAGNEPTVQEMDLLMSQFSNSWFSGTQELLSLKAIQKELSSKASAVQEAWITPTLLNGATGTVQYRRNSTGRIEFRGSLNQSSTGSACMALPVLYRPLDTVRFTYYFSDKTFGVVSVNTGGGLYLDVAGKAYDLNVLSYPV